MAPKVIVILAHRKEMNKSSTKAFHDQNHKNANMDPTTAPTTTWLTV